MLAIPRYLIDTIDALNDLSVYPYSGRSTGIASLANRQELANLPRVHGDKFHFNLNMHQFDPSEISVKFDKGQLTVHGKREKKGEDGSYVYREYKQMCTVPENVLHEQMKCRLDENGHLRIEAPVKQEEKKNEERHIPIVFTEEQQQQLQQDGGDAKK